VSATFEDCEPLIIQSRIADRMGNPQDGDEIEYELVEQNSFLKSSNIKEDMDVGF
jgi:hypothetical protein